MIIPIQSNHRTRMVEKADILYVRGDEKAVKVIYMQGGARKELRTWQYTVKSFAETHGLLQIHRGVAVNKSRVVSLSTSRRLRKWSPFAGIGMHEVELDSGDILTASRRFSPNVRRAIKSLGHKQP